MDGYNFTKNSPQCFYFGGNFWARDEEPFTIQCMNQHHRSPDVSSPSCPSVSPVTYIPPFQPPSPHPSLSADQTASFPFSSPPTPSSHIPLSCAATVHKYINLVSVYAVCVCVLGGGGRHIGGGGPATPQAGTLSCVTRSQTVSVYTSDPSRRTSRPLPALPGRIPEKLSPRLGKVGDRAGSRLGGGGARRAL